MAWEGGRWQMECGHGHNCSDWKEEEVGGAATSDRRPPWGLLTDLPQQLGHNFDLLATGEQVAEGYTSDTRHLHGVHQHHEPLQQPQGQEGIFEAVHCQAAACLVISVLGTGTGSVRRAGRGRGSGWGAGGRRSRS